MEIQVSIFKSLLLEVFNKLNLKSPACIHQCRGSLQNTQFKCFLKVEDTHPMFVHHRLFIGLWKDTLEQAENSVYEKVLLFMENKSVIKVLDLHSSALDRYKIENEELKLDVLQLLETIDELKAEEGDDDTRDM